KPILRVPETKRRRDTDSEIVERSGERGDGARPEENVRVAEEKPGGACGGKSGVGASGECAVLGKQNLPVGRGRRPGLRLLGSGSGVHEHDLPSETFALKGAAKRSDAVGGLRGAPVRDDDRGEVEGQDRAARNAASRLAATRSGSNRAANGGPRDLA